jgi:hypothetical protein
LPNPANGSKADDTSNIFNKLNNIESWVKKILAGRQRVKGTKFLPLRKIKPKKYVLLRHGTSLYT